MPDSPNQPDPRDKSSKPHDEEPETYELNLEDEDQPESSARSASSDTAASTEDAPGRDEAPTDSDGDADDDIYDLAEPEPDQARKKKSAAPDVSVPDPRLDRDAVPPAPSETQAKAAAEGSDKPIPKLYQTEPDPAFVDPAVAASRREQARIRAAQQLAIEEAKRRKIRAIVLAVIGVIVLIVLAWLMLLS